MDKLVVYLMNLWEALGFSSGGFVRKRVLILGGSVTLSALGSGNIDIDGPTECDFIVTHINAHSAGDFTARISKTDDDKYITDGQIHSGCLFGASDAAGDARRGIDPMYCNAGAKWRFELVDLSNASNAVKIAIHCRVLGVKSSRA